LRTTFRIVLCVALLALAVTMASFTVADLTRRKPAPEEQLRLGAWQGSVAVFDGGDSGVPKRVTDIDLSTLRATDRALIERGYPVESEEALQALLEDLGS
jgi:hypothetical protein